MDLTLDDADFRRRVGVRAVFLLGEAIDRNGGRYSGSLVPNITSVAHILADSTVAELRLMVEVYPLLNPEIDPIPLLFPGAN